MVPGRQGEGEKRDELGGHEHPTALPASQLAVKGQASST